MAHVGASITYVKNSIYELDIVDGGKYTPVFPGISFSISQSEPNFHSPQLVEWFKFKSKLV